MIVEVFFVWFAVVLLLYVTAWLMRGLRRTWREFWRDRSDECRRKD